MCFFSGKYGAVFDTIRKWLWFTHNIRGKIIIDEEVIYYIDVDRYKYRQNK
ncbi:MAG: hypothetical protein F6K24_02025 [Okeania sp. SIO2D1]|nr:hypothetical protein [Okeania sp. SIO2D1]